MDEDDEGDETERLPHSDLLGEASVDGDVVLSSNYITAMARLRLGLGNGKEMGEGERAGCGGEFLSTQEGATARGGHGGSASMALVTSLLRQEEGGGGERMTGGPLSGF